MGDGGRGGEDIVGEDHGPERGGDGSGPLLPLSPVQKEGDAEPGAEQNGGADHMEEFEREIEVHRDSPHRFSWNAITTSVAAIIGTTLSKGPK